jgi:signal transduction histidine kinase
METSAGVTRTDRLSRLVDVLLVVGTATVGIVGMAVARTDPDVEAAALTPLLGLLALLASLPIWWRRRWPLGMLGAFALALFVTTTIDEAGLFAVQVALVGGVLLFAVGAWSGRRWWSITVVAALAVVLWAGALADGGNLVSATALVFALVVLPAVLGYATRTRRQYVAEVERRLAEAERDRDVRAHQAVVLERQRIARELHDVVAHHVSLIGVQAGAARTALDSAPDRTRAALEAIEASSRAAVGEMRQLLEVLAPSSPEDGWAPQPALEQLPALVDRWRAAGVTVDAVLTGDPAAVAPTVSLCCYRVVEEALTNVARHSMASRVSVRVAVGATVLVEVIDPGPPRPDGQSADSAGRGTGRGLVGMRERVALCGGRLDVGPADNGSFRVLADVPLETAA